jgi:bifunctional non-homologous end joining protein LigD
LRWVKPEVVIEAEFRGFTADLMVRQGAFKGVREDKPAKEVVLELPANLGAATLQPADIVRLAAEAPKPMAKKSQAVAGAPRRRPHDQSRSDSKVRFTHPGRVYWDDVGVTKQDLADYYRAVWKWMAPHLVNRPIALLRCPEGTKGECFFQKHIAAGLSEDMLRVVTDKKGRQVIAVDSLDGLLSLVQAGVLPSTGSNCANGSSSTSIRGRGSPGRTSPTPRVRCVTALPPSTWKASSSFPAARESTSCCRSRRPTGRR